MSRHWFMSLAAACRPCRQTRPCWRDCDDLGRFYLLGVAAEHHPELLKDQATLVIALDELDRTAGRRLLEALGLPPTIVDAVAQRGVFRQHAAAITFGRPFLACWLAPSANPFEDHGTAGDCTGWGGRCVWPRPADDRRLRDRLRRRNLFHRVGARSLIAAGAMKNAARGRRSVLRPAKATCSGRSALRRPAALPS